MQLDRRIFGMSEEEKEKHKNTTCRCTLLHYNLLLAIPILLSLLLFEPFFAGLLLATYVLRIFLLFSLL